MAAHITPEVMGKLFDWVWKHKQDEHHPEQSLAGRFGEKVLEIDEAKKRQADP